MGNLSRGVVRLALPLSVLLATCAGALLFRYEVHAGVSARHLVVHDRWAGTARLCVTGGLGFSKCYPFLGGNMEAIAKPEEPAKKATKRISDEEFQRLLDKLSPPPNRQ